MSRQSVNLEEFIFSCKLQSEKIAAHITPEIDDEKDVEEELEILDEEEAENEDVNDDWNFDVPATDVDFYVDEQGNIINDLSGDFGGISSFPSALVSASGNSSCTAISKNEAECKNIQKLAFPKLRLLTCEDIQKGYSKLGNCKEPYNKLSLAKHGLTELGAITNFTNLTEIDISGNYLQCVRSLGVMQYLQKINASSNDIDKFLDICPVPIGLKEVDFSKNCISRILNLKPFWSLTDINLSYNSLTAVDGFEHMIYLKSLDLSHNMISRVHLNCPNLLILNLKDNCLSHGVTGFEKCTNICSLNLAKNQFSEIGGLKAFGNIVELHLERNHIASLFELDNLKLLLYLHCLWIHHNKISDLEYSRLMLIYTLPQLLLLDGQQITIEEMKDAKNIFDPSFIKLSCEDHTNTLADRACQPGNTMFEDFFQINPSPPIILLVGTPKSECHKIALLLKEKFRHNVHLGGVHSTATILEGSNLDIPVSLESFSEMKNRGDFLSTCHILGRICGFATSQISRAVERKSVLVASVPLGIAISMRKWKMRPKLVLVLPSNEPEFVIHHGPPPVPKSEEDDDSRSLPENIEHVVHFENTVPNVSVNEHHDPYLEVSPSHSILKPAHFELNTGEEPKAKSVKKFTFEVADTKKDEITEKNLTDNEEDGEDRDEDGEEEENESGEEETAEEKERAEETRRRREELMYYPKREKQTKIRTISEYLLNIPSKDSTTLETLEWKPEDLQSHILEGAEGDKTFYMIVKKHTDKPLSEEIKLKVLEVFPHRTFIPENFRILQEISPMQNKAEEYKAFFENYRILVLKDDTPVDSNESEEKDSLENLSGESRENMSGESEETVEHSFESSEEEYNSEGESGDSEEEDEGDEEDEDEEEPEPEPKIELSPHEAAELLKQVKCIENEEILKNILESGEVPECVIEELELEINRRKDRERAFAAVLADEKESNICLCTSPDNGAYGAPAKEMEVLFSKMSRVRVGSHFEDDLGIVVSNENMRSFDLYGDEYHGEGEGEEEEEEEEEPQKVPMQLEELEGEGRSGQETPKTYTTDRLSLIEMEDKLEKAYARMNSQETERISLVEGLELLGQKEEDVEDETKTPHHIQEIIDKTCREIRDIEHHKFKHQDALAESIMKTREQYAQFHQENPGFFHFVVDTADMCHSFDVLQKLTEECIHNYSEVLETPEIRPGDNSISFGGMNLKDSNVFLENRLQIYRNSSVSWVKGLDIYGAVERVCCRKVGHCNHIFMEKKRCPADILEPTLPRLHCPTKFKSSTSVDKKEKTRVVVDDCITDQYPRVYLSENFVECYE